MISRVKMPLRQCYENISDENGTVLSEEEYTGKQITAVRARMKGKRIFVWNQLKNLMYGRWNEETEKCVKTVRWLLLKIILEQRQRGLLSFLEIQNSIDDSMSNVKNYNSSVSPLHSSRTVFHGRILLWLCDSFDWLFLQIAAWEVQGEHTRRSHNSVQSISVVLKFE